jgi:PAS domain S-box-containing protein
MQSLRRNTLWFVTLVAFLSALSALAVAYLSGLGINRSLSRPIAVAGVVLLCCNIVVIWLSLVALREKKRAVRGLISAFGQMREGNFSHRLQDNGLASLDEAHALTNAFVQMTEQFSAMKYALDSRDADAASVATRLNVAQYELLEAFLTVRRYEEALNAIAMVTYTNEQDIIVHANENFYRSTGYSRERIIGHSHRIMNSGHHPPEFFAEMWRTIATGQMWHREIKNVASNGQYFWVDMFIVPQRNENSHITGYIAVSLPITERKQMEEELRATKEKAESANKAKSEFLANMSHEIRTPLNAIMGFAHVLVETASDEQTRRRAQTILTSGSALLALLNDLLDLSKIEAGKLELVLEEMNLLHLITDVTRMFSEQMQAKHITFYLDIDEAFAHSILADILRLRQVLFNLVGNAIKFTEQGFVRISAQFAVIEQEYVQENQQENIPENILILEIEDTGIGIAPEDQQRIFEPFLQSNKSNKRNGKQSNTQSKQSEGGTGLGLPIVKRLIDLMGGTLKFHSIEDIGTLFHIELPFMFASSSTKSLRTEDLEGLLPKALPSTEPLVYNFTKESFTQETLKQLPQLIALLRSHLLPQWDTFGAGLPLYAIEAFGASLRALADEYNVSTMDDLGLLIERQAHNYELEDLPATLAQFPRLLAALESLCRTSAPNLSVSDSSSSSSPIGLSQMTQTRVSALPSDSDFMRLR